MLLNLRDGETDGRSCDTITGIVIPKGVEYFLPILGALLLYVVIDDMTSSSTHCIDSFGQRAPGGVVASSLS